MTSKVITIASQKGGVGKTHVTVNLGAGLVRHGKRVLLIDADQQGSMTASLGIEHPDNLDESLAGIMESIVNDEDIPDRKGILYHEEGMDFLPGNIELSGLEVSLVNIMSRESILRQYVDGIRENYDYILIDTTPSLGMLTINALAAADSVIIPVQPEYLSIKGLQQLIRTIGKVRKQINRNLKIEGIILTMTDARTTYARDLTQMLVDAYGGKVQIFDARIPYSVRAKESSAEGVSIFRHDPRGKVAAAYEKLTEEVLSDEKKSASKIRIDSFDDLFSGKDNIVEIPLSNLHTFRNHPFRVVDDDSMAELAESIRQKGVLNPAIVRRAPAGYEILSGHRRKRACEIAGLSTMPCVVLDCSDDEAAVIMVDSNIQREEILPSEKARAYRMKYDALKHQGVKTGNADSGNSLDIIGEAAGESGKTVQRFNKRANGGGRFEQITALLQKCGDLFK